MRRLDEVGIRPVTKHGQNFLVDLNLQDLLVRSAKIERTDVVLEVGTGTGSLTARIADLAGKVLTVEIDAALQQLAAEELAGYGNVEMLLQDALRNKNNFSPVVLEKLKEKVASVKGGQLKLVANLPFNIATPVIANLLSVEPWPVSMTVTIQKELADRIVAVPGTRDYSALSIWIQSQCHVEIIRELPPTVFWPKPKVISAIIQITPDPKLRSRIVDRVYFKTFVRSMFFHRRKFLRSELIAAYKDKLSKPEIDEVMAHMQFPPDIRADNLEIPIMIALCELMRAKAGE